LKYDININKKQQKREDKIILDSREMIRIFIKKNYSKIFSDNVNLNELKKKKTRFFVEMHKNKYENPNWAKLAHEVIQFLVDSNQVSNQDNLITTINSVPYLNEKTVIRNFSHYQREIIKTKDKDSLELMQNIKEKLNSGEIENIIELEKAKTTAIIEMKEELEEKLSSERKILDEFRSRIDEDLSENPVSLSNKFIERKKIEIRADYTPWWKKLGLIRDPFPSPYGLKDIEEELYDKVVVKLPIFQKYSHIVTDYPDILFGKPRLFYGEFGCGKTTLFDYLIPFFIKSKIVPLEIMLDASQTIFQIRNLFDKKLYNALCNALISWRNINPRSYILGNSIDDLIQLFRMLLEDSTFNGFVIFLDGLHKYDDNIKLALDFLKGLQNFFEEILRENIKISLFIAGSKLWIKELRENSAYEGTIFKKEPFDSIGAGEAFDLITKRLEAFSEDNTFSFKKYISYDDIKHLMNIIQRSYPREITFRTFIEEFANRISDNKDFGLISIDYKLDQESIEPIILFLRTKKDLFNKFSNLRKDLGCDKIFLNNIAEILCVIQEKNTINEEDKTFENNIELFKILNKYNLIVRNKKKNSFIWGLSSDLRKFCLEISRTYRYALKYYINQVLYKDNSKKTDFIDYSETVFQGLDGIARGNPIVKEKIIKLKKNIEAPYSFVIKNSNSKKLSKEIFEKTKIVSQFLLNYLYEISGEEKRINSQKDLFNQFLMPWMDNDLFRQYIQQLTFIEKKFNPSQKDLTTFIASFVSSTDALINKIKKWMGYNDIIVIGTNKLTNDDKKAYNAIRSFFWQYMYKDCVGRLWTLFETKFRELFFNLLFLLYGSRWKTKLPHAVQDDLSEETENYRRKQLPLKLSDGNELYLSKRKHLKMILKNSFLWGNMFKFVFGDGNKDKIIKFLDKLVLITNPERHNNTEEFFTEKKDEIRTLLKVGFKILKMMNSSYEKLISNECLDETNKQKNIYQIFLSFNQFKDKDNLEVIEITKEEAQKIIHFFKIYSDENLEIDLSCLKDIKRDFFSDYRKVLALLCAGIKAGQIQIKKSEGSVIVINYNQKLNNNKSFL